MYISVKTIIEKLMDYYCLNQQEFSKKYNINSSQVSRWLNGKSEPRNSEYLRLLEEYNKIPEKEVS